MRCDYAHRFDMIALLLQTVPKAHHNLAQPIITLNSPQAIITAYLLYGRYAEKNAFGSVVCPFLHS